MEEFFCGLLVGFLAGTATAGVVFGSALMAQIALTRLSRITRKVRGS